MTAAKQAQRTPGRAIDRMRNWTPHVRGILLGESDVADTLAAYDAHAARIAELEAALQAIAAGLDGERNRFGKLESYTVDDPEPLRLLACKYDIGGASDQIDQAVKVARAVLAATVSS